MIKIHRCALVCLTAVLIVLSFSAQGAQRQQDYEARLKKLNAEMQKIQRQSEQRQKQRGTLTAKLRQADQALAEASGEAHQLRKSIQQSTAKIKRYQQLAKRSAADVELDQERLAKVIRAQYQSGGGAQWRLFFEPGESVTDTQRYLTYHRYVSEQRQVELNQAQSEIAEFTQAAARAEQEKARLSTQQAKLQDQLSRLAQLKRQRNQDLKTLQNEQANSRQRLVALKQEQTEVQKVLEQLQRLLQAEPEPAKPIRRHRGKLIYPVDGDIVRRFQQSRSGGVTRWQGVMIESAVGQPVRAVYAGRVVYTGWVAGYGHLVILDHGGSYMSVYGNNQSILVRQGDLVEAGDQIALTGESAGQNIAGSYLEIRVNSKPTDPAKWISRRATVG